MRGPAKIQTWRPLSSGKGVQGVRQLAQGRVFVTRIAQPRERGPGGRFVTGGERSFDEDGSVLGFTLRLPVLLCEPERSARIRFEVQAKARFLLEVQLFAAQSG